MQIRDELLSPLSKQGTRQPKAGFHQQNQDDGSPHSPESSDERTSFG